MMKKLLVFVFAVTLLGSCENKNGIYKTYHENGSLKEYAEYKDGKLHGTTKTYFKNENFKRDSLLGQLSGITEYKDGSFVRDKSYYKNDIPNGVIDQMRQYRESEAINSEYEESSYDGCPYSIQYETDGSIRSMEFKTIIRGVKCEVSKQNILRGPNFRYQFQSVNPNGDLAHYFKVDSNVHKPVNQFYYCGLNINYTDSMLVDHQTSEAEKEEMEAIQEAEMSEIEEMEMRMKFDAEYEAEQQAIDD